tara:strand:- start:10322 stop:10591 length:270 start_codon:yes stop_codon:yes gene_type:complete
VGDILTIVETFGIPVAVAMVFGFFIWKQNKYIQDDLISDINGHFKRLEGIVIKLIDQQKKNQIELKGLKHNYQSIVDIVTKLLKDRRDG